MAESISLTNSILPDREIFQSDPQTHGGIKTAKYTVGLGVETARILGSLVEQVVFHMLLLITYPANLVTPSASDALHERIDASARPLRTIRSFTPTKRFIPVEPPKVTLLERVKQFGQQHKRELIVAGITLGVLSVATIAFLYLRSAPVTPGPQGDNPFDKCYSPTASTSLVRWQDPASLFDSTTTRGTIILPQTIYNKFMRKGAHLPNGTHNLGREIAGKSGSNSIIYCSGMLRKFPLGLNLDTHCTYHSPECSLIQALNIKFTPENKLAIHASKIRFVNHTLYHQCKNGLLTNQSIPLGDYSALVPGSGTCWEMATKVVQPAFELIQTFAK